MRKLKQKNTIQKQNTAIHFKLTIIHTYNYQQKSRFSTMLVEINIFNFVK